MRLFLVWTEKGAAMGHLISELQKNGHEIVYWLGYDGADEFKSPKTIFHSYRDAIEVKPASGVDVSTFLPPEKDLLEKLYEAESLTLTMLNLFFFKDSVSERKHRYYKMVWYWLGVLKKYQPDALVLSYIPHYSYDFVLYSLAKLLGIKVLTFVDTRIPGRLLPLKDFWQGSERLKRELSKNSKKNFSSGDLVEDIRKYYLKITDKNFNEMPDNLKFLKSKHSLWHRLVSQEVSDSIKNGTIFRKATGYLWRMWRNGEYGRLAKKLILQISYLIRDNAKKEYRRCEQPPNWSKKFIYVPLQVQPECSTSPQGGIFADQILMLETLSAALPKDWVIYVKEHPIQWLRFGLEFSGYKYRGYYEQISKIKNVKIVPIETSSYKLNHESQAVVTITGAAGWEATLWDKPAMIFGYPWYWDCPEIFHVSDTDSCRQVFEKISAGFKPDQQKVINYLKALEQSSIHGYNADSAGFGSGLSRDESMENIADFIVAELKNL